MKKTGALAGRSFWLGGWLWCVMASAADAPKVDFVHDIQPLFDKHCYSCHDGRKVKGGLRLDVKSNFFRGGDSGKPPVIPGKSGESQLITRVSTKDEDEVMPPKGEKLNTAQINLLKAWVDQGADWPASAAEPKPHWAYVKPVRPAPPEVKFKEWPRNEIDYFILSRLEKESLAPSPEADRTALIRRVSLDLTGLPPTVDEVNEFVADKRPDAYEKLVDRLLGSPHYGERWARPWLDMARYADTMGFEKDDRRRIWPYRDWVINALNQNMRFDEFTIEQLAGDLLPNATRDQRVATGFHRNTMTNAEGGTDDEEFRHEAIIDRVNTTFAVWMGSTFNCAQCHNHKYDPFTMRDYYGVYAILNQTADSDKDDDRPSLQLPNEEQAREKARLQKEIDKNQSKYDANTPELAAARAEMEQKWREYYSIWSLLRVESAESQGGATLQRLDGNRVLATGKNPANDTYTITCVTPFSRVRELRLDLLPNDSLPGKSFGRDGEGTFILSRIEVSAAPREKPDEAQPVKIESVIADQTRKDFDAASLAGESGEPGWSLDPSRNPRSLFLKLAEMPEMPAGVVLKLTLRNTSKRPEANLGSFRIAATSVVKAPPRAALPFKLQEALALPAEQRSDEQEKDLDKHLRDNWSGLAATREKLANLRKDLDNLNREIPSTLVFEKIDQPRETHVLIRGSFLTKGDLVTASVPAVLPPADTNAPLDRLNFARWIVSTNNPLTARVQVNRYWEQFFGRGIVETTEEFGKQGEPPTHPELLDWLATEFMRTGWDIKAVQKTIVMSATYRQSSVIRPEQAEHDPQNRLLARGPRVRLEAEMIRDQALTACGLLSQKIGGPSVMPYQPDGLWQVVYSGDQWSTSKGEDRYRRGLYTFWRRSAPHPTMVNFDAPSREYCVLKRNRSNTPLQALDLLNDPAFVEFAQALARRTVREGGKDFGRRLAYAFQSCVARKPTKAETERLAVLFEQELARFKKNRETAEKLATDPLGPLAKDEDAAEMAAWTVIANVLLNLDEMITKG